MKPKIIFIMHMPPPIHGASMVGQYIHDSNLINKTFECVYINLSSSKEISSIGKLTWNKLSFMISNLYHIVSTIRKEKPALCYLTPSSCDWGFYRGWITIMILKCMKCNIIVHFHNKPNKKFRNRWYNKLLYHLFFKNISTIFLSKRLSTEFKQYINSSSLYICNNGIPLITQQPFFKSSTNTIYTFLFLSNLIKTKGVFVLLEACSILKRQGINFQCQFIGKWGDITESSFQQYVKKYNLQNNVFYLGPQYGQEKDFYLKQADAFVFPTYYEGECFPLVILEAMQYKLPCISTYEGGIPDIIDDGITGILVKQQNVNDLAKKMLFLISNPQKGYEIGENAYNKFINNYTINIFEKKFTEIIQATINK